ncbi:hypothetical protein [Labilibaculum antarcticum]|uniref:DUF4890 domain-containing protein n=1 Tax=Labilibaculum antarcticum TaxID=1717717 RepID=A0A1Y1CME7_9BACT|nr:hypothetical protein [Labilibaculum antarcticum]BAX81586.1 hypothetical protein ALGA_3286 [Labilibaculum antarcticum]
MKTDIKKIASILMIVAITAISGNLLQAQPGGQQGPPPIPNTTQIKKMVSELSKTLDLTDEKSEQLSDLYTAHFKEISAKVKNSKPSKNEMDAFESKFEKEVKAILSPEQQEQFEAFLKENKPKQNGPQKRR